MTTLADSFRPSQNDGHFSIVLLSTIIAYVLSFMVFSPFSAALLVPQDVIRSQPSEFLQPQLNETSALEPALETLTFLKTIGHILQNTTAGQVHGYEILDEPISASKAWNEPFVTRPQYPGVSRPSEPGKNLTFNITTRSPLSAP